MKTFSILLVLISIVMITINPLLLFMTAMLAFAAASIPLGADYYCIPSQNSSCWTDNEIC